MIDTVVLQLACKEEQITSNFFGAQQIKYPNGLVAIRTVFTNMHKKFKAEKKYYPMIIARKRMVGKREDGVLLEIQVSLPKLLYGTNLWEVTPNDLRRIYDHLQWCLKQTGIELTIEVIAGAILKRVDFSKTFRLPTIYGTAKQVTRKLSCFEYKPSSQFKYRDYGNFSEGAAMKFYNDTQGYVLYDKCAEMVGNGYTKQEEAINQWYKETQQRRDVIRFELSLERKQSMEAVLRRFISTKKKDFILADIMATSEVSKKILIEVFDIVFNTTAVPLITLAEMQDNQLETFLRENNLPMAEHHKLYYWVNMVHKFGLVATLEYMKEKVPKSTLKRYKDSVAAITAKLGTIEAEIPSLVGYLRKKHEEFRLISPPSVVNHC